MGTPSLPSTQVRAGHAQPWTQLLQEGSPQEPVIVGADARPSSGAPGDRPESPPVCVGGGGRQEGEEELGAQAEGWEDAEVEMEVSVRARAHGEKFLLELYN